jgi:hypothetical protein
LSDTEAAQRYADYAEARGVLLNAAAKRIPLASLAAQARALQLWRHNQVEPGSEEQLGCVLDLGVFSPVGGHKPALERVLNAAIQPPEGSADAAMLDAFTRARFGLFRIGERDPRGGITLHDICTGQDVWVMDPNMAETGVSGTLLGARLAWPEEFALTCGVLCPVDVRVLLYLMENRPPHQGPVHQFVPLQPHDPMVDRLLEEAAAPARLAEMAKDPLLAANAYRAALDLGLYGPVPGR